MDEPCVAVTDGKVYGPFKTREDAAKWMRGKNGAVYPAALVGPNTTINKP
jgi:hypothetical protein